MNVVRISSPLTNFHRSVKYLLLPFALGFIILSIASHLYVVLFVALAIAVPIYLFTKLHSYVNVVDVYLDSDERVVVFENLKTKKLEAKNFGEVIEIKRWLNSQTYKIIFQDGTEVPFILFDWMISIKEVRTIVDGYAEVKDFKFQEG